MMELIKKAQNQCKANLHAHSTLSDCNLTSEIVLRMSPAWRVERI